MLSTHNKFLFLLVLLICSSANAAMYSCVDENGTKVLRNHPCEQNEKQQVIKKEVVPSHSVIDSTGERQDYRSRKPGIYTQAVRTPDAVGNNRVEDEVCEKMLSEYNRLMNKEGGTMGDAMVAQGYWKKYTQCKSNSPLDSGEHTQTFNQRMEKIETKRQLDDIEDATNKLLRKQRYGY